jgi:rubredoxin
MPAQNTVDTRPILHYGTCPSCGEKTSFDLLGIQSWPEKVAQAAGFPAIQTVWQCRNCDTTLLEPSLKLNQSA